MDELPPPVYSEQEFDQKISATLEASLDTSKPSDEWEEWDEAKFEAAARQLIEQSTPSSSRLYSEKCAQMESVQSWKKTQSSGSSSNANPLPAEPSYSVHDVADDEDAPPPFTPVGPSLDGPPFEEAVMQYSPPIMQTSPPVSPLESPDPAPPEVVYRHSMPVLPQNPTPRVAPRPVTTYTPAPRVDFNTSMAYNRQPAASVQLVGGPVDVSALYNSSVSAYLRPVATQRPVSVKPAAYPVSGHMSARQSWMPVTAPAPFSSNSNSLRYSTYQSSPQTQWPPYPS